MPPLTLKAPNTSAADDKFCDTCTFPNTLCMLDCPSLYQLPYPVYARLSAYTLCMRDFPSIYQLPYSVYTRLSSLYQLPYSVYARLFESLSATILCVYEIVKVFISYHTLCMRDCLSLYQLPYSVYSKLSVSFQLPYSVYAKLSESLSATILCVCEIV